MICKLCSTEISENRNHKPMLCDSCFLLSSMINNNPTIAKKIIYAIDKTVTSDMTEEQKEVIVLRMETYGGSFVKQLAALWRCGDSFNKLRVERIWSKYFEEYKNFGGKTNVSESNKS